MPTFTTKQFNISRLKMMQGYLTGQTISVALVMTNSTAGEEDAAKAFVGDLTTLDEFDGANYARKDLVNVTIELDDANTRAILKANNPVWDDLWQGTRDGAGLLFYVKKTNDADHELLAFVAKTIRADGSDYQFKFDDQPSNGVVLELKECEA